MLLRTRIRQNDVSFTEYLIGKYSFDKNIMRIGLLHVMNKGDLFSVLINDIDAITCDINLSEKAQLT